MGISQWPSFRAGSGQGHLAGVNEWGMPRDSGLGGASQECEEGQQSVGANSGLPWGASVWVWRWKGGGHWLSVNGDKDRGCLIAS